MKPVIRGIPIEKIRECYVDKHMSTKEIAKQFHVCAKALRHRMRSEGIPVRTRSEASKLGIKKQRTDKRFRPHGAPRKRPSKDEIFEYYVTQKMSLRQVGELFGVSQSTIQNALKEYGIPTRPRPTPDPETRKWEPWFIDRYHQYRNAASNRGHSFELTAQQFYTLVKGNCYYCGNPPSKRARGNFLSNGIDRADNSQGYTLANSRSCCAICNRMKGTQTEQEFAAQILRIADRFRSDSSWM